MLKEKKSKNTDEEIVVGRKTAKEAMEELNRREQSIEEDASESTVKNILNKVKEKGGTITYGELAAELRRC